MSQVFLPLIVGDKIHYDIIMKESIKSEHFNILIHILIALYSISDLLKTYHRKIIILYNTSNETKIFNFSKRKKLKLIV